VRECRVELSSRFTGSGLVLIEWGRGPTEGGRKEGGRKEGCGRREGDGGWKSSGATDGWKLWGGMVYVR
jgi:hypothetical protein